MMNLPFRRSTMLIWNFLAAITLLQLYPSECRSISSAIGISSTSAEEQFQIVEQSVADIINEETVEELSQLPPNPSGIMGCLRTVLGNPGCLFTSLVPRRGRFGRGIMEDVYQIFGRDRSTVFRDQYNEKLRSWKKQQELRIEALNETMGGNFTTPFPLFPPFLDDENLSLNGSTAPFRFLDSMVNFIPRTFTVLRSYWNAFQPVVGFIRTAVEDRMRQARDRGVYGSLVGGIFQQTAETSTKGDECEDDFYIVTVGPYVSEDAGTNKTSVE